VSRQEGRRQVLSMRPFLTVCHYPVLSHLTVSLRQSKLVSTASCALRDMVQCSVQSAIAISYSLFDGREIAVGLGG
jgi:hypothetical protein